MYEELLDIIFEYIDNESITNIEFYHYVYSILEEYFDLKGKINVLEANDILKKEKTLEAYNPRKKVLFISPYSSYDLMNQNEKEIVDGFIGFNRRYFDGLDFTSTLIHELEHARLFTEIENGGNKLIHELAAKSSHNVSLNDFDNYEDFDKNDKLSFYNYRKNHDLSPIEINAHYLTNKSIENLLNLLNNTHYSIATLEWFKALTNFKELRRLQKRYIIINDEFTTSPSYEYCDLARTKDKYKPIDVIEYKNNEWKKYLSDSSIYSLDERLEYGLQLSKDELYNYSNSINEKIEKAKKKLNKYKR